MNVNERSGHSSPVPWPLESCFQVAAPYFSGGGVLQRSENASNLRSALALDTFLRTRSKKCNTGNSFAEVLSTPHFCSTLRLLDEFGHRFGGSP